MSMLGVVEDTLFVPMQGRIYASEHFPQVLMDEKAMELKEKLPPGLLAPGSQYTLLASACRAANMDRFIRAFLERSPDGAVIQLGCGLDTAYYRCDDGKTRWYAVDLPHVVAYRRTLLPEPERETYIAGDAFADGWIRKIRADMPDAPLLITAGGLFHYFQESRILSLFRMLQQFGAVETVFDTVNRSGMAMMRKRYIKQVGHADAQMFFYVDAAAELAAKTGNGVRVIAEEPYYRDICKKGLPFVVKRSMAVSDRFGMVKMVHLKL